MTCIRERSSGPSGKKKLHGSGGAAARSPEASTLATKYEALRVAGLGQALPPEARNGLALLLRRGMWGWARALVPAATAALLPNRASSPKSTAACHSGVIQIIAAMAMIINDRRSA